MIGVDETNYQVHKEKGRKNTSVFYMRVSRGKDRTNRSFIINIEHRNRLSF